MPDRLTIAADIKMPLAAIDAIPAAVHKHLRLASETTADHIADEAQRRAARRTGRTAEGIHVEEALSGDGFVVLPDFTPQVSFSFHVNRRSGRTHTQRVTQNNLPIWLEFGTRYMVPQPYLFVSARLEEGAHNRRAREAVIAAIEETGLGE